MNETSKSTILGMLDTRSLAGRRQSPSGSVFIGNLGSATHWLHRIYAPADPEDIADFETSYSITLTPEHARMLESANGATLFDVTFYIYGIGPGNFTRSLDEDDQAALSLDTEIKKLKAIQPSSHPAIQPSSWVAGWYPVASLTALERYGLEAQVGGRIRLVAEKDGRIKYWDSLDAAMCECIAVYDVNFCPSGIIDDTYESLEAGIAKLFEMVN